MAPGSQGGLDNPTLAAVRTEIQELRHFGLVLGVLFGLVFAGIPLLRRHAIVGWPWLVAAVLWMLALIVPATLRHLHRGWARLGEVLGWLNTRIILSLVYVVAVVPIGLIMRLRGRDPMKRRFDPAAESYRVVSKQRRNDHLEQPF
jgi:Saxitoxin biosynthesis operon protein SxtJ